jgi:hypothetical protein
MLYLVLSVGAPVGLALAAALAHGAAAYALLAYVLVFSLFEWPRRLGRAGYVPTPGAPPVVLGGGWSWVLRRRACPANAIACRRGPAGRPGWWHAGTTIGELQRALAREGRTLAGHPSISSATLGGWIASGSHGSGGSLWTPTMGRIVVDGGRTLPSKAHFAEGMVVREVEILSVPNVMCERRLAYLEGVEDVREHLFRVPTHLRAVFVDRSSALAVTWTTTPDGAPPAAGAWPELPPLWLLMLLPAAARRGLRVERWRRRMTLRAANDFAPPPPFVLATGLMRLHTNFEIVVTEPTTPELVHRVCRAYRALFASGAARGRMELRFGRTVQFLDFDLAGGGGVGAVFATLREVYGANCRYALHKGKADVRDAA